jgi:MoaA/NifB/PqqE/SkfB family radical SAM enzyme
MSNEIMEAYIRQTIEGQKVPAVTIAWQGGEPTLMGLDFYRHSIDIIKETAPREMQVEKTMQTNGVLLDEEWCRFLHDNNFLVGLSLDGPRLFMMLTEETKRGIQFSKKSYIVFDLCKNTMSNSTYCVQLTQKTVNIRLKFTDSFVMN